MTMADDNTTDTKRDLVVTRVFDAPVEQVWKAWSDPEYVMQWWGQRALRRRLPGWIVG
jgi:uncharacterized protein YndB with AHSA1/START domain